MNYRHIYHAGNACDVVKHATLALLLKRLGAKETPFCVLDTHAGLGLYDLNDECAQRTGEADAGIRRLAEDPESGASEVCAPYLDVCRKLNPEGGLRFYPGSPKVTRSFLRPADRLMACELHPEDARTLKRLFFGDKQVQIHARDGYEALRALLPPKEKRGLVLIDPPFEEPGEFARMTNAVRTIAERWPTGMSALWYPIKERAAIWAFHEDLAKLGLPKILAAEFLFQNESRSDRLNGSGFVFVNPPWHFEDEMSALFRFLAPRFSCLKEEQKVFWITEEK